MLSDEEFSYEKIYSIVNNISDKNITLAEIIILNENFPKDKILLMLQLNISSEMAPNIVAEKAKKFFDFGLDDNFIKDIFENSESLTIYSDEVLKILQKRKIDDPETPLSDIIKALVGNTPNRLQEK